MQFSKFCFPRMGGQPLTRRVVVSYSKEIIFLSLPRRVPPYHRHGEKKMVLFTKLDHNSPGIIIYGPRAAPGSSAASNVSLGTQPLIVLGKEFFQIVQIHCRSIPLHRTRCKRQAPRQSRSDGRDIPGRLFMEIGINITARGLKSAAWPTMINPLTLLTGAGAGQNRASTFCRFIMGDFALAEGRGGLGGDGSAAVLGGC